MTIKFTVPGTPASKGRPQFARNGNVYTPKKTRDYEAKIVQCWKCQSGKSFAPGVPLEAKITAYFPLPKSLSKKRAAELDGTPHIKRRDVDNIAKIIMDALNTNAYQDDGAIAFLTVQKYQTTGAPRVEVTIQEVEL